MTSPSDRKYIVTIADEAHVNARWHKIAKALNISTRTLSRWAGKNSTIKCDRRPDAQRPIAKNKLTEEDEKHILDYCNSLEYASLTPDQIVSKLADQGLYIASERSFYRVLQKHNQIKRRGKAKEPIKRTIPRLMATGANQVYTWDITYLKAPVKGLYYYLYMFMDIFSRKIVGWEIFDVESGKHASDLLGRVCFSEGFIGCTDLSKLIIHSDNGGPMKSLVLREKVTELGVDLSFSRPSVSNDNPYSEALFKTLKYRPDFPDKPFESIEAAREWTLDFVLYYNDRHQHSGISFVTPAQRHRGEDVEILKKRKRVYQLAKCKHPERWSGDIKQFNFIDTVYINRPEDALISVK